MKKFTRKGFRRRIKRVLEVKRERGGRATKAAQLSQTTGGGRGKKKGSKTKRGDEKKKRNRNKCFERKNELPVTVRAREKRGGGLTKREGKKTGAGEAVRPAG